MAYWAAKGDILALSRALSHELGLHGMRVNTICRGMVETAMLDDYLARQPDPQAMRAAMIDGRPIKRPGRPEDVAEAVLSLASDAASWATGSAIFVDGGSTA